MTDAESLAAAAADECRKVLEEKDRILTAARDERDAAREALREWVAAHDAERAAAFAAAEARHKALANQPAPPKKPPRGAVLVSSLPPDEQRRIEEDCARFMAPINAAEDAHAAARGRLAKAVEAARAALPAPVPPGETTPAPSDGTCGYRGCWLPAGHFISCRPTDGRPFGAAPAAHPETGATRPPTPEESAQITVEGRALRAEVHAAVQRMTPKENDDV